MRRFGYQQPVDAARKVRNLTLVGFMGCGKSSVGQLLAQRFRFYLADTDQLIEQRTGKEIAQLFDELGEPAFRKLESEVVKELESRSRLIISTGGGAVTFPENLASLQSHSLVVCLWASAETILERTRHTSKRPLLRGPDPLGKIKRLLAEREPHYKRADIIANTDQRTMKEVAQYIYHQFVQYTGSGGN
ncbi:MAG: shikimate kinase [Pedosphaera sp.]|nr:shikimate kinase [Pedosphaera sp.]